MEQNITAIWLVIIIAADIMKEKPSKTKSYNKS